MVLSSTEDNYIFSSLKVECLCLIWTNCHLLYHLKSSNPSRSSSTIYLQCGIRLDAMIKQKKNSREDAEERRAKLVVSQFRTYWLLSVSSSGIWAQLPASGSANEFVSVGGESGSSEQQNEGRLLVSEMASGLQQQEAELCRPRLFCSLPAKSPISWEECGNSTSFSSNSRRSVLSLHLVDTLWKSFNTPSTM